MEGGREMFKDEISPITSISLSALTGLTGVYESLIAVYL